MSADTAQPPAKPTILSGSDPSALSVAVRALRHGAVVAIPTDTVYGLAAAIDQLEALDRLFAMKDRPPDKPIPVLLSDPSRLGVVASQISELAQRLATEFWPGALTIIVPAVRNLPEQITSQMDIGMRTVAVRVPGHDLARSIIAAAGGALAVTSANFSGESPAVEPQRILEARISGVDYVVDDGRAPGGVPSTIVLAVGSRLVVTREGAISMETLVKKLGRDFRIAPGSDPLVRHTL